MNRQKKLFSLLLGLFGLALTYGISTYPRQERVVSTVPEIVAPSPARVEKGTRPLARGEDLQSPREEMDQVDEEAPEVVRNIFEPLFPTELPPVPSVRGLGPEGEEPPPEVVLPPPPTPFKLLGYLRKNHDQLFFLTRDSDLFVVKPQETFGPQNNYRIVEAEPDEVVLEDLASGERTRLTLVVGVSGIEPDEPVFNGDPSRFRLPAAGERDLPEPPVDYEEFPGEDEEPSQESSGEDENGTEGNDGQPSIAPGVVFPESDTPISEIEDE
jgi:hypothetical protein